MRSRSPRTILTRVFALLASCALAACGGGGSGGGGGGGGGGGSPAAPTGSWVAPTTGVVGLSGETLEAIFTANDDGAVEIRIFADVDGNTATTGDQTLLFGPVGHASGANQSAALDLSLLPAAGVYTLFLRIDDGVNAPLLLTHPLPMTVILGLAAPRGAGTRRPVYGVAGNAVAFAVGEQEQGPASDRNGDADQGDGVIAVVDLSTGTTTQGTVAADTANGANGQPRILRASGGTLSWIVPEAAQGMINADGDQTDRMLAWVTPGVSVTPQLNLVGGATQVEARTASRLVVPVLESEENVDRNGDGDTNDVVWATLDLSAGGPNDFLRYSPWPQAPSTPAGLRFEEDGNAGVAFRFMEQAQGAGGTDFNADADMLDTFLWVGPMTLPAPNPHAMGAPAGSNAGMALPPVAVDAGAAFDVISGGGLAAAYHASEPSAGGVDINGDGDALDVVPCIWDATTQVQTPLAIGPGAANALSSAPGAPFMAWDGNLILFTCQEGGRIGVVPGSNNDGDGGVDTQLFAYADRTSAPVTAQTLLDFSNLTGLVPALAGLSLDGGEARVATAGVVVVSANEAANGNADLNGNGVVDQALLLIDTTASPPAVIRPVLPGLNGLVPFDTVPGGGTIPATGISDGARVVFQVREGGGNGILNGDGDNTDILLAYVNFAAPLNAHLLDAGGDHVTLAGGRIATTARESYTNTNLDGQPGTTGFALRVYDGSGNVLLGDLPSAASSIPAADDGTLFAWLRDETTEGEDLNGDGDMLDLVLGVRRP